MNFKSVLSKHVIKGTIIGLCLGLITSILLLTNLSGFITVIYPLFIR